MLAPIPILQHIGKEVTLVLSGTTLTGTLVEITPDFAILETGDGAETQLVYLSKVLAMKVRHKQ